MFVINNDKTEVKLQNIQDGAPHDIRQRFLTVH